MTKAEKIADMLSWLLISERNRQSLIQQFNNMAESEIDARYASQMKRRAFIEGRRSP